MDQEGLGARVHGMIGLELLFFFALTLVNGFFAMSEMALVSARRARLGPLAESSPLS